MEVIGSRQYRLAKLLAGLVVLKLNNEKWLYSYNNSLIKRIIQIIIMLALSPTIVMAESSTLEIIRVYSEVEKIKMAFPEQSKVMLKIAHCESGIRQFNEDGSVLISKTADKGIFQINQVHWDNAKKLGIDIDTIDGNIAYARYLYDRNGTRDWYMSKKCWN